MRDKVLFIDGMNQIWRANVSFAGSVPHEPFVRDGETICTCLSPWNIEEGFCYGDKYHVIYHFFRNLRPLIAQFEPDKCFFVLEGRPQFRYDLYGAYKANRLIKTASRQQDQQQVTLNCDLILSLLTHLPITQVRAQAYECDDLIGSLCHNMQEEELTIISSDSDFIQLLQRGYASLQIYNPIKKSYMKAPEYPYVAGKALAGDKSDNIPALLKPKKAIQTVSDPVLFQQFLQLEENRANFNINRQLIELRQVPEEEIEWQEGERNFQFLLDAFRQMKFQTMIRVDYWKRYVDSFQSIKY